MFDIMTIAWILLLISASISLYVWRSTRDRGSLFNGVGMLMLAASVMLRHWYNLPPWFNLGVTCIAAALILYGAYLRMKPSRKGPQA